MLNPLKFLPLQDLLDLLVAAEKELHEATTSKNPDDIKEKSRLIQMIQDEIIRVLDIEKLGTDRPGSKTN